MLDPDADAFASRTSPEARSSSESSPGAWGPPPTARERRGVRRWLKVLIVLVLALAGVGALAVWWEARTSWLQSRWFSDLAAQATYQVEEGPAPQPRYPGPGPYNLRLGYAHLESMGERAESAGFRVVSQARLSEGFHHLLDQGAFPVYREKDQAGLVLLDRRGEPFLESLFPRQIYASFDSVPPPVRDALLFIESKGRTSQTQLDNNRTASDGNPGYHGRY